MSWEVTYIYIMLNNTSINYFGATLLTLLLPNKFFDQNNFRHGNFWRVNETSWIIITKNQFYFPKSFNQIVIAAEREIIVEIKNESFWQGECVTESSYLRIYGWQNAKATSSHEMKKSNLETVHGEKQAATVLLSRLSQNSGIHRT